MKKKISLRKIYLFIRNKTYRTRKCKIISKTFKIILNFLRFIKNKNMRIYQILMELEKLKINSIKNFFSNKTNLNVLIQLKKLLN